MGGGEESFLFTDNFSHLMFTLLELGHQRRNQWVGSPSVDLKGGKSLNATKVVKSVAFICEFFLHWRTKKINPKFRTFLFHFLVPYSSKLGKLWHSWSQKVHQKNLSSARQILIYTQEAISDSSPGHTCRYTRWATAHRCLWNSLQCVVARRSGRNARHPGNKPKPTPDSLR